MPDDKTNQPLVTEDVSQDSSATAVPNLDDLKSQVESLASQVADPAGSQPATNDAQVGVTSQSAEPVRDQAAESVDPIITESANDYSAQPVSYVPADEPVQGAGNEPSESEEAEPMMDQTADSVGVTRSSLADEETNKESTANEVSEDSFLEQPAVAEIDAEEGVEDALKDAVDARSEVEVVQKKAREEVEEARARAKAKAEEVLGILDQAIVEAGSVIENKEKELADYTNQEQAEIQELKSRVANLKKKKSEMRHYLGLSDNQPAKKPA